MIYNNDGSESGACGNGARCVADLVLPRMQPTGLNHSAGGRLAAWRGGLIAVDMGPPKLDWAEIPLATAMATDAGDLGVAGLPPAVMVNMGNPHAVHFVADAAAVDLENIGPMLEHHAFFPERATIEVVSLLADDSLRMRVWERGAGVTIACGSGACASLVAAVRRGLVVGRRAEIILDGGRLDITWQEDDGHVIMRGGSTLVFSGIMTLRDSKTEGVRT